MIIVSQNKKIIYNFNNLNCIFMNSDNEIRVIDNNYIEGYNGNLLGKYKTEERAKEVLKDIVLRYEAIELCKNKSADDLGYTLADYTPVYEIPEE